MYIFEFVSNLLNVSDHDGYIMSQLVQNILYNIHIQKKFLQVLKYFCGSPYIYIYIYIYNPDQIYEITSSKLKINFILYLEIGRIERPNSRSVFNI